MRKFGRIYKYDERDYKVRSFAKPYWLPIRKFWGSRWFGDQGVTPQCVGYAVAHLLEASPIRQYVNPSALYQFAQYIDEWEGENYAGTSVRAGVKVLSRLGFVKEYAWLSTAEDVQTYIASTGPVVLGVNWYDSMMTPQKYKLNNAYHYVLSISGKSFGGHAILADGTSGEWIRLKNSWGRVWGERGRAYIHKDELQRLLNEEGEACVLLEQCPLSLTITK